MCFGSHQKHTPTHISATPATMLSSQSIMKALVIKEPRQDSGYNVPIPAIDEDEILVRVIAVALNPTDWKGMCREQIASALYRYVSS